MNEGTVLLDMKSENVLVLWAKPVVQNAPAVRLRYTMEVFANEQALADACKDDPRHYEGAEYYSIGDLWMRARSCRALGTRGSRRDETCR